MQGAIEENIYLFIIVCTTGVSILVTAFVVFFIQNQNKLLQSRQKIHTAELEHQKKLLNMVIQSQEDERKRIGQDLHDAVGSSLANLRMLSRSLNPANKHEVDNMIDQQTSMIDKIIYDVRNISHSLFPPSLTLFGFNGFLEELSDIVNSNKSLKLNIANYAPLATDQFTFNTALSLIRVLQELISNTIKHAAATIAEISIFIENEILVIRYEDNGIGYSIEDSSQKRGMGMQNIESRLNMIQADYNIITAPEKGFVLCITLGLE